MKSIDKNPSLTNDPNMAKINLGRAGENLAVEYLSEHGYTILEQNWRWKKSELDIIAKKGRTLVIVEVKTRSYDSMGAPEEAVGRDKEKILLDAANQYAIHIGHDWAVQIDIISIIIEGESSRLRHYEDAIY